MKKKLVDLHMHTYFSDGSLSPEEVVELALQKNIKILAVCDHYTIDGLKRTRIACERAGIEFVVGVVLDVDWNGSRLHLLGYNFDIEGVRPLADSIFEERELYNRSMIENLSKDFTNVSLEDYDKYDRVLERGGWKAINYLYDRGLCESLLDCMKYYKSYATYKEVIPSIKTACEIIRKANGVPILAHPGSYWGGDTEKTLAQLTTLLQEGIRGIECFYPLHSKEFTAMCVEFCKTNNLCITYGSDCHGLFLQEKYGNIYDIGAMQVDASMLRLNGITLN